ncbi:MAG: metallopeptidase TldD-related protein [Pseudomonadota bacterium]
MPTTLEDSAHAMLRAAQAAGADAADAIATEAQTVMIDVREGGLETAERSESVELGLRVIVGKKQASVSISMNTPDAITAMAERAVAMAREAPEDATVGLSEPDALASSGDAFELELADPADEPRPGALEEAARSAEAAALTVPGISQVQSTGAAFGRRSMHIAATNGFSGGYARTENSLSCVAITGQGTAMERDYAGEMRVFAADLPTAEDIGRLAGERTAARAGARKPPTGAFPVLYDERIASSLISHLLQAANGATIVRGASWLRDALGEAILPKTLSLIEDPHRLRSAGSKPFDAEGLPTARRAIVDEGVLTGWTLDLATARKLGMKSTANAARSAASAPTPSNHSVALSEGPHSRDALIAEMGTGLIITGLIGSAINPTNGDYSRGASGFWVENGAIAYPVNECTVAGNLRDMLKTIMPANDARPHLTRVVPSLLVEGLTIAGA